ncbi:MAG: DMT family transporter [Paracoccaceae bacterium]|jgi:drug/metabolite transporter (DMT)-like permease
MQPDITWRNWLMVAALGLIWGSSFMVVEVALTGISPFWLAASRVTFGTLLTVLVWMISGRRFFLTGKTAWPSIVAIGVLSSALPFSLLSWGQTHVTSGFAGVSMASIALLVLPLSHFFVPGEQMTLRRTIGFLIGFGGVALLIGPEALAPSGSEMELLGRVFCVLAASCYAISSVIIRRLPPIDPLGLAAIPLIIGAITSLCFALTVEGPPPAISTETLWIILYLGLVPTAGANLLRILTIRSAGPVFMSLTNYQVPLWSVILGIVILEEAPRQNLFLAMTLILIGLCLSQYGALKRLFRPE